MSINDRINELIEQPGAHLEGGVLDQFIREQGISLDEPLQVAQVGKVRKLLEPLLKKGATASPEPKIVAPEVRPIDTPPAAPAAMDVPHIEPPVKPKPITLEMPALDEVQNVATARQAAIASGHTAGKPPEKAFNTEIYDDKGLQATVNAVADAAGIDYSRKSIRSIYEEALAQGLPEDTARRLLQGLPMNSTVGDNGLALNTARVLTVWDESGKKLDGMFQALADGKLDDHGMLDLRRQLAIHEALGKSVKGFQVDIARTMNVFKRVRDAGPALDAKTVQDVLDSIGTDHELLNLAEKWLKSPTKAGRNALVERGMGGKAIDAIFYTAQSNMLSDVSTQAVNFVSNAVFGVLQPIERLTATGIGRVRTLIPGTNPERYTLEDNLATTFGFYNAILDGWKLAGIELKRGLTEGSQGLKADQFRENPLTAEFWSGVPLHTGRTGDDVWRTPDLKDTAIAKVFDMLAAVQALPFKGLSVTDDFFGGIAARMQLHSEAWRFANTEYDRLIAAGVSEADAAADVQRQVGRFLTERPADMQASIDQFRKMVTFQTDLADYRDVPTGGFYNAAAKVLENPAVKPMQMFVRTLSNIWIEGTARTPGLNFISPRFYEDFNAGGHQRDMAVARLALGGSAMMGSAYLAWGNRVTGYGPQRTEDRAALEALGWQPYSLVFERDELSARNLERLSKITKVSVGEDKVYVSYSRFEPLSFIFAFGADVADAAKFHTGSPSGDEILENDWQELISTGSAALYNYMTNLPLMQGIGNLMKIAQTRNDDKGDKLLEIMDGIAEQYGNVLLTGLPVVGMANSSLLAHVERLFNPTRSNTMPDRADVGPGERAFYANLQRLRSRIPGLSDDVPELLDHFGRPKVATTFRDHWVNWTPMVTARTGQASEADEVLASLNFGIHMPSKRMDGVAMSATQYNRYVQLYGQEIRIDGRNLEEMLPHWMRQYEEDSLAAGVVPELGDKQKQVASLVEQYRKLAKWRMVGDPEGNPVPGADLGLGDDRVEFPELRSLIERNANSRRIYGR